MKTLAARYRSGTDSTSLSWLNLLPRLGGLKNIFLSFFRAFINFSSHNALNLNCCPPQILKRLAITWCTWVISIAWQYINNAILIFLFLSPFLSASSNKAERSEKVSFLVLNLVYVHLILLNSFQIPGYEQLVELHQKVILQWDWYGFVLLVDFQLRTWKN